MADLGDQAVACIIDLVNKIYQNYYILFTRSINLATVAKILTKKMIEDWFSYEMTFKAE